ncbi:uncharacterized protein K452DRAFT_158961 [Aplosporella prunicola CBS 121167]|uniref:Uncharacterized protein n=1 Tax=Aplosporella prunicola CBS 121167 TaxID=1176127 RepID=A0A6A6AX07_9PEZI|nr:uncharacterized protein K452DRAFT_158961 [Aplosporella prunicola CBS 121167]KAF2135798.1 hypothetical protein K452DRAFT_158961 [Aplosporella prunicola CBS 121167]
MMPSLSIIQRGEQLRAVPSGYKSTKRMYERWRCRRWSAGDGRRRWLWKACGRRRADFVATAEVYARGGQVSVGRWPKVGSAIAYLRPAMSVAPGDLRLARSVHYEPCERLTRDNGEETCPDSSYLKQQSTSAGTKSVVAWTTCAPRAVVWSPVRRVKKEE